MSDLRYGLLGPLEVIRDGDRVAINGPKLRVLLATLLLRANSTVSVDQLGERMWGENPPSTARKSVQLYVMRLRRILGDDGLIETRPDGYLMKVPSSQVDLLRFRQLTQEAREADELVDELHALTEAVACWRGPALSDVPSESLQRETVAELAEDRLRTVERRIQVLLDLGRHREVISDLVQHTKDHPWHEQFWIQLIQALHRSDRLADALDTYRTVHRKFREELGIDPGPQLRQLQRTIFAEPASAEPDTPAAPIGQLPADIHSFVGRAELIPKLTGARGRVTVISGPPGFGKTSLALHVAHLLKPEFPDGQLYVDLQGYAADPPLSPAAVLTRFLKALGVPRDRVPSELESQAALYRSLLGGRRMLLLLDNAVNADQVRPLLPGDPGCHVLITSRGDLRGLAVNPGADQLPLGELSEEESIAILAGLIGAERASAEPESLVELVWACGRLPLALRIAGANLAANPHRTLADYLTEMRQFGRLTELAIDGDKPSAVRVAFDHSYLRLGDRDRELFQLLGLAPGPDIGVSAAAALADLTPSEANRALDRLTAAALLQRDTRGRYRFHDLIREYAASQANAAQAAAAMTRLADYYLHTAHAAAMLLYPGTPRLPLPTPCGHAVSLTTSTASHWLDNECYNLVAVVTWAAAHPVLHHYAWRLVDVLRGYLQARGHAPEAIAAFEAALYAAEDAGERAAQISMLDVLGVVSYNLSDYKRAIDYHRRAQDVANDIGDTDAAGQALHHLGRIHMQMGQPRLAERYHRQALAAARKTGNVETEILALNYIGVALTSLGMPGTAIGWHERSLALSESTGNRTAAFRALNALGIATWRLGRLDEAISLLEGVIAYCQEIGERFGELITLVCTAEINCDAGRLDLALTQANQAMVVSAQLGERRSEAGAREVIATVHNRQGRHIEAIAGYTEALHVAREIGFGYGETSILIGLASAHRNAGEPAVALAHAEQVLIRLRGDGQLQLEASALIEVAHAYLDLGNVSKASHFIGQAVQRTRKRGETLTEKRALDVQALIESHKDQ
ncbi:DNA-binding SARP family transcriptional activator/tetratricopeptide (TPR) repeat protein [Kibdelosporangium banguiense]|uniref:DNA-binding SARP family transcriptional activator/tetratricopeptide (TPR) repeat protein n=1 Tax=Kibdelosporangium banguiense TaxID=1365924 RepID=A0ABS4TKK0_9PSEU|nr:tetratricopeptide repeat protein [Kibdelosporangium banguiense]MBP2324413.1 DNA-binding SARP family transcriptional activator/tetratricopeptide (TPR) repeat protein [Kibdelosporangium banguiense]